MTPLELSILLHYRGCANDYMDGDFSAPAVREAIDRFADYRGEYTVSGMLEESVNIDVKYQLSAKGNCFVDALCSLPPPVLKWEVPK